MLLLLDFQPGRGEFLPQVEHFEQFLRDPCVSVALDPEWKMRAGPGARRRHRLLVGEQRRGGRRLPRALVARYHLPDKLLMVHQFTLPMLPDRQHITPAQGVEIVFHADGFGTQSAKIATWNALDFPGRPVRDRVQALPDAGHRPDEPGPGDGGSPRPDIITYQ